MPRPIDEQIIRDIGSRVRAFRVAQGFSQETLAKHLELTFQQVQKYENGKNRVSAATLARIADFLRLPVEVFFEPVNGLPTPREVRDNLRFNSSLDRISDGAVRRSVAQLVETIAGPVPAAA